MLEGVAGTVQAVVRVIARSYAYNAGAVPAVGLVCAHKLGFYVSEYQRAALHAAKQVLNLCR